MPLWHHASDSWPFPHSSKPSHQFGHVCPIQSPGAHPGGAAQARGSRPPMQEAWTKFSAPGFDLTQCMYVCVCVYACACVPSR